mmetsp:Transcript_11981/g.16204  ORF Transcript_11981/g.16204 Transcript_11981/m.16204 type:complete len:433 (+) Transcript_11981:110-1408(+)
MITALLSRSSEEQDPPANSTSLAHENEDDVAACEWHVVAELCPIRERPNTESEIVETFSLGTSLRVDEEASVRMSIGGQERGFEWLKIIEPIQGWCRASQCSVGDYATLGASWQFVVVCQDGAFVREGLELASPHIYTLAKDAVFQVYERRVNEQGLARLRTDDGWLSEDLNPLSGQRGPIALLLPISKPLKYRVILPDGAVVRETVELSSAIVHIVPCGDEVIVDEKQFSDHPAQHCVPRLHLIRPFRGWISQRLNREPPDNLAVVELVGIATDHDLPQSLLPPEHDFSAPPTQRQNRPSPSQTTLATHTNNNTALQNHQILSDRQLSHVDNSIDNQTNFSGENTITQTLPPSESLLPAASQDISDGFGPTIANDALCVVCLSARRNSTFVHGETGHIACCLSCARALKARGDTCPVCRMTIERVIQHFQA